MGVETKLPKNHPKFYKISHVIRNKQIWVNFFLQQFLRFAFFFDWQKKWMSK